jgi:endonuclease/exonuclease/phosphatase family metal-dependent hydrolase
MMVNPRFVRYVTFSITIASLSYSLPVRADALATYNFDAQTPAPSATLAGLTASNVDAPTTLSYSQGNPSGGSSIFTSGFASSNYFDFSLTPSANNSVSLSSLTLDDRISATGPTTLSLQYELPGATSYTTIGTPIATATSFSTTPMVNFSLSSVPALQSDTSPVSFRLVGSGASSSAGTLRLDNVAVNGTVTDGVPISPSNGAGYLRIATYNVTGESGSVRSGFETIVEGMANETVQGHAQPVDALVLEESSLKAGSSGASATADDVVAKLNAVYGANTYADVPLIGASLGAGTQALVYKTSSLTVVSSVLVGTISSTGIERQEIRYQLRPANTTGADDFYVYAGHWKADTGTANATQRNVEAQALRQDAVTLGASAHIIYAGDFNLYGASETAYTTLTAAGVGAAVDPANQVGAWHGNAAFVGIDTQAPLVTPPAGFASGGLDDRFDFELDTSNILTSNGNGLTYVAGSYHTFGNNGSVALGGNINDAGSTALPGLSNRLDILNDLSVQTDHLPVMADYYYLALLLGDANGDGMVDVNDLNIVLNNLGTTSSLRANGNFDGAATIDLTDLNDVLNNLGMGATGGGAALQATPEPSSLSVVAGIGILLLKRRRPAPRMTNELLY